MILGTPSGFLVFVQCIVSCCSCKSRDSDESGEFEEPAESVKSSEPYNNLFHDASGFLDQEEVIEKQNGLECATKKYGEFDTNYGNILACWSRN